MRAARSLFFSHLLALAFGLGGLLVALPRPELWADSAFGADVFNAGMRYGGSVHIILGALTMLAFGGYWLGWRRTLIFFGVTVPVSFAAELIGTTTGWPFGNYAYTDFLGYKLLGHVPFTIPLSWFYFGFASYLLANTLVGSYVARFRTVLTIVGGAYLLTVWDLALDPAMAHEDMTVRFWNWSESGPYVGMPLQNFAGWAVTAMSFMAVSRLLWRQDVHLSEYPTWLPFGIYAANMLFAIVLALSVGLWVPAMLGVVLGLIPAAAAWHAEIGRRAQAPVSHRNTATSAARVR